MTLIICHRQKQGGDIGGVPWFNKEQAQPMQMVSQPPVASYGAPEQNRPQRRSSRSSRSSSSRTRAKNKSNGSNNPSHAPPNHAKHLPLTITTRPSSQPAPIHHRHFIGLPQPRPPLTNAGRAR
ncbi:hypothetical protein PSEUDO9AG_50340 [Pseudomonas sp. 9Ag]|nr:hypothetical protein PSEUDO9AG_50340 [Pseudomonas sp. 9Ag]